VDEDIAIPRKMLKGKLLVWSAAGVIRQVRNFEVVVRNSWC